MTATVTPATTDTDSKPPTTQPDANSNPSPLPNPPHFHNPAPSYFSRLPPPSRNYYLFLLCRLIGHFMFYKAVGVFFNPHNVYDTFEFPTSYNCLDCSTRKIVDALILAYGTRQALLAIMVMAFAIMGEKGEHTEICGWVMIGTALLNGMDAWGCRKMGAGGEMWYLVYMVVCGVIGVSCLGCFDRVWPEGGARDEEEGGVKAEVGNKS